MQNIEVARRFIQKGEVGQAYQSLQENVSIHIDWKNRLELLLSQFNFLQNSYSNQLLAIDDYILYRNRNINALIDLISDIEENNRAIETKILPTKQPLHLSDLANIVGREDIISRIISAIEIESIKPVSIHGIGGIGKSIVAKLLTYKLIQNKTYKHIGYIDLHNKTLFNAIAEQHELLAYLGMQFLQNEGEVDFLQRFFSKIEDKGGPNLLILDNLNPHQENGNAIKQLYNLSNWKVLIVSRSRYSNFYNIEIPPLELNDSLSLFHKHYLGSAEEDAIKNLLQTINYHTLTIELLAKTLEFSLGTISISQITQKFLDNNLDDPNLLLEIETDNSSGEQQVITHLLLTFSMSELSDYEKWILCQLAAMPVQYLQIPLISVCPFSRHFTSAVVMAA